MKIKNITLMCICLFIIALCTSACGGGKTNTQTQFVPVDHPVPVEESHALILSKTNFTVNIGATDNITVTLNNEDVTENASYTPEDESVATVEKGVITGLKQGTTRVNIHFVGAEADKTFTVNVIDKKLPNLELSQNTFALKSGETANIKVTLEGEDVTESVNYAPDNESIASVQNGLITAINKGSTDVVVSREGANNAIFTVNVDLPTLEVSKNEYSLNIGEEDTIKVTLEGKDVTESVVYTPENKNIATADKGTIKAQFQEGQTDITVSLEGANDATFTVNVKDDSDEEVELNETVMNKLYELGLIDKDYEHRTELTEINIPGVYTADGKKYKIIGIAASLFYQCKDLESVTIPNSVITIGVDAFKSCLRLKSIIIPDSVKTIGEYAFHNNYTLETVTLGNSVETIGQYAFYECYTLKSIIIPDSVKTIGQYAFYNDHTLETVTLGNSVETIGNYDFRNCFKLKSINIPDSVKTIGEHAFENCYELQSINIPDSVTTIGERAFFYCDVLETVTLGNGLETIGKQTFSRCHVLKSIIIPDSVKTIETSAFYEDYALETVTLGNNLETIEKQAFEYCYTLKSIIIPDSVKTISNGAFRNCYDLETVTLGNELETIGEDAFRFCYSLKDVTIPDSVTSIGRNAFQEVKNIIVTDAQKTLENYPWTAKKVNGETPETP